MGLFTHAGDFVLQIYLKSQKFAVQKLVFDDLFVVEYNKLING